MIENILIHTCCADCLLNLVHSLEEENIIDKNTHITLFFYNPNIHPRSEYLIRLDALKIVIKEKYPDRNIKLVIPDYRPKEYFESIVGKTKRCLGCWELRLSKTFEYAKAHNIPNVSSTLLGSHYQDINTIIQIGETLANEDIHLVSPHTEHEHLNNKGFYKQNYCGCCYSLNEKMWEKFVKTNANS